MRSSALLIRAFFAWFCPGQRSMLASSKPPCSSISPHSAHDGQNAARHWQSFQDKCRGRQHRSGGCQAVICICFTEMASKQAFAVFLSFCETGVRACSIHYCQAATGPFFTDMTIKIPHAGSQPAAASKALQTSSRTADAAAAQICSDIGDIPRQDSSATNVGCRILSAFALR